MQMNNTYFTKLESYTWLDLRKEYYSRVEYFSLDTHFDRFLRIASKYDYVVGYRAWLEDWKADKLDKPYESLTGLRIKSELEARKKYIANRDKYLNNLTLRKNIFRTKFMLEDVHKAKTIKRAKEIMQAVIICDKANRYGSALAASERLNMDNSQFSKLLKAAVGRGDIEVEKVDQ